ncbi:MAG TPA: polyprenyl synthetase family protein [Candidatus Moranbacteria bacterium]|nr:polyprenyl synthetase family protein [Candidatus Moranbacteria bacterium]
MDFKKTLAGLKKEIDKELELQLDIIIRDIQKKDVLMTEAFRHVKKIILAGGKRIRGALLCQAYFGLGGKEKKKILKVAAAVELMHMFFLVHDDIMDRGELRHGKITLHRMFSLENKKYNLKNENDREHFGNSEAIIVGDMLYVIANKIIIKAGFKPKISIEMLTKLQSIAETTAIGQSQDWLITYKNKITKKEIMDVLKNKTAKYTFEGPLQMGAILAGCNNKKMMKILSNYALSTGIAFQIQDDILGIFGDEKKMGKSSASDIEEGKQTLLVMKAKEKANFLQKKQLNSILGRKNLTQKEIKNFQNILKSTGALEYSKKMSADYLVRGKKEIKKMPFSSDTKKFLLGLAEYLEDREK